MLKVLLVDDHGIVRLGLKQILREAYGDVLVGEASSGTDALKQTQSSPWDVIVLDITMPGMSGIETLKRLKHDQINARVLMLSMHTGVHYVAASLQSGAAGYLSKETAPEELVDAVETVLGGGTYVSGSLVASTVSPRQA